MQLEKGEYKKDKGIWYARVPSDTFMVANLNRHDITEHEDGTITVEPSIFVNRMNSDKKWHGYLRAGTWERLPDSTV